jgi:Ni/Co efflux regulator RcnB
MNDRARDERARAAVERIKAAEQEEKDRMQARLDELAAESRTRREAEAKQERAEADRRARLEEGARAEREEREKRAAFRDWTAQGGNPQDFEAEWPAMRTAATRRRVEESAASARARQRLVSGI